MSAEEQLVVWMRDPLQFVRDVFDVEPDEWQAHGLRALPHKQRMAFKACKGPGKTCLLAWMCWWFLVCHEHANMAAVSITSDNLRDGLWKEMAKWQLKSELLKDQYKITKTRIFHRDFPDTWWFSARSFPKTGDAMQQADALAGLHADYLLFVLDEAGGIPDAVMATAEAGLATGIVTKIVIAGNPTHLEGPLYRACTSEAHLWHTIEITGDPDDPMRSPRISIQWAREQIEKYGADNPWVLVNVFGRFPPASLNSLFGPEEVNAAMRRVLREEEYNFAQKRIGVDVARFGDDRTVIFKRQGLQAFQPIELRNLRGNEIAARVIAEATEWGCTQIFVDDTGGWGASCIDSMIQAGWSPIPVCYSQSALDSRYLNKRAEMYFEAAEWVKRGGVLYNQPELVRELTCQTYSFKKGKFCMTEKDQIKSELGFSPDISDAFAQTFALPEMPGDHPEFPGSAGFNARKRPQFVEHDYDPFDEKWWN